MKLEHFLSDLKDYFYVYKTFNTSDPNKVEQNVLQTIKKYFIKKDYVVISKYEYDKLVKLSFNEENDQQRSLLSAAADVLKNNMY